MGNPHPQANPKASINLLIAPLGNLLGEEADNLGRKASRSQTLSAQYSRLLLKYSTVKAWSGSPVSGLFCPPHMWGREQGCDHLPRTGSILRLKEQHAACYVGEVPRVLLWSSDSLRLCWSSSICPFLRFTLCLCTQKTCRWPDCHFASSETAISASKQTNNSRFSRYCCQF